MESITTVDVPGDSAPSTTLEPFSFTGSGGEYFRIWIVNLALSIVTLGIYSAWAKVRRLEYFYRNTRLAGSGFEYHGSPIAILKGRIVGFVLFGAYSVAGRLGPVYLLVAMAVIAVVMPFLLNRALRFRCANSSYRGVRFAFHGSTAGAYKAFLLWPLAALFSLFTLWPLAHQRIKRYEHSNASYGQTRMSIGVKVAPFYGIYIAAALMIMATLFIALMVLFGATLGTLLSGSGGGTAPSPPPAVFGVGMVAFMTVYLVGLLGTQAFVTCRIQNLVWNSTALGDRHGFTCKLAADRLLGLLLTNTLATVFTLGLFTPFAQVRMARFMIGGMTMVSSGSLDEFVAAEPTDVSALGEESAGFFDIDIAF